jgi:hypothetical protein
VAFLLNCPILLQPCVKMAGQAEIDLHLHGTDGDDLYRTLNGYSHGFEIVKRSLASLVCQPLLMSIRQTTLSLLHCFGKNGYLKWIVLFLAG